MLSALDLANTLRAANLCAACYNAGDPDWAGLGFDSGLVITADDQLALVGVNDGQGTVAVRGSDNLPNWIEDGDFLLVDSPFGGKVHKGFLDAFTTLEAVMVTRLAANHAVVAGVTGHSLGAAVGSLIARSYGVPAWTFGCPRVGDQLWAGGYITPQVRVVDDDDLVPRLPLWAMGYRHVGTQWYITKAGTIEAAPDTLAEEIEFLTTPISEQAAEHSIARYVAALTRAAPTISGGTDSTPNP